MKKNLQSGNFYDTEIEQLRAVSKASGWPMTQTVSFFCRWGLKNYAGKDIDEFSKDLTTLLAEAVFHEHTKTSEWQKELLEAKNVRREKGS